MGGNDALKGKVKRFIGTNKSSIVELNLDKLNEWNPKECIDSTNAIFQINVPARRTKGATPNERFQNMLHILQEPTPSASNTVAIQQDSYYLMNIDNELLCGFILQMRKPIASRKIIDTDANGVPTSKPKTYYSLIIEVSKAEAISSESNVVVLAKLYKISQDRQKKLELFSCIWNYISIQYVRSAVEVDTSSMKITKLTVSQIRFEARRLNCTWN